MHSALTEKPVVREACNDVFCPKECVDRYIRRVFGVCYRIAVNDRYVLKDQSIERPEMDLLELYVSVQLFRQIPDDFSGDICLDLRKLDYQCSCR